MCLLKLQRLCDDKSPFPYIINMNITQSILIFILSVCLVVSVFCLLSCYFRWKLRRDGKTLVEESNLMQKAPTIFDHEPTTYGQIEMQPYKRNSAKINLTRLTEINNTQGNDNFPNLSKRILNSLDSIRTTKSDGRYFQQQTPKHTPSFKHIFISKLVNYTCEGIELLDREIRTVKRTKVFRELTWQDEVIESVNCHKYFYPHNSPHYFDVMEVLRLEEEDFKALRVKVCYDMANCVEDREYMARDLSQSTSYQTISVEEFKSEMGRLSVI